MEISGADKRFTDSEKMDKVRRLVSDDFYQGMKEEITGNVTQCMNSLLRQTRSSSDFEVLCRNLEIGTVIVVILMVGICLMIRHQAEHDALTELLNRGSYKRILNIYETGERSFALILIDVDTFKSVNDTYGHAMGDTILQKVAALLKRTFRSIDYVCRIVGDEFAIIMVEMTSDLKYTIEEKIEAVNETLSKEVDGVPAVSLSVGVAFSDRDNAEDDIFKDADKALYYIKEHGRHGCKIF